MEGCPRSSMLSIDLKDSIPVEFSDPLKKYISDHYQEDPDNYKHECLQLEQLRSTCLHPSHDHSGCSVLRRYFAQLQFLLSRFPMVDGGSVSLQFTWTDLYSEESIALADVRFEQAAILHNLGALHSQLGCQEDRTGEEGMKVACTHFQAAAGVFQYLKNTVMVPLASMKLPWVSEDHFAVPFFDLASCVLQLYINILLGQAQECLLEKSILDGRKDSLIARISMQVYDYYQQALGILESLGSSYLGSKKSKMWTKAVKIKAFHFTCVSYIHMSNHAHENQKFGEKVAYLKAAQQKLTEAQKQSKGQPERTLELLQFMADVVNNKLEGAVKDNDFIYHEVVTDLASLPVIKGASLVKPIPFQPCDPSVAGPDIFQRLIPIEAHSDASIYSEEKAKLLRRYNASVELKNKQLVQSLASLHIDDLLQPVETDTLPSLLKEKHESLSRDAVLMSQADDNTDVSLKLSDEIENILKNILSLLDEDVKKELLVKEKFGPQETPPERKDFKTEHDKCQEALFKANQTNNELGRVYDAHKQNLELIAGSEERLLAALPSLNIVDSPVDDGAVQRLRDLIAKVEEMKVQRKSLEESLRNKLSEDDITGLLVTREDGNKMAFFYEQLKKHDTACSLIQANLDAQDKILSALTEANAKYAKTRKAVKENSQRREEAVQALILSFNTFCELQGKLSRGVEFYQNLLSTVTKLEEKCKNFFDNHSKELSKLIEKIKANSEPPKPPSRPSAAKPDHLVRPQQTNLPPSIAAPILGQTALDPRQPRMMYQYPGVIPGQLPPGSQGQIVPPGEVTIPGHIVLSTPQIPPVGHRPGQSIPGQIPGQIPGLPPDPISQGQGVGLSLPASLAHSVPHSHIPADQTIHSTPRMSYPFPVSQGQIRGSGSGHFPRHNLPGQIPPHQGGQIPGFQYQNQVPPNQKPPPNPANLNTLSQIRPLRPESPNQVPSHQQPDLLSGQQQRFPGQLITRPHLPPQQQQFTVRPQSSQPDLISQVRPPFSTQNSVPFHPSQQVTFHRPAPHQSPMGQPPPLRPQQVPGGPSSLPLPLQPQTVNSASTSPQVSSSQVTNLPGQPPMSPQQQFQQPPSSRPSQQLPPSSVFPGQNQPSQQQFRPQQQMQPQFRPDERSPQPYQPGKPPQHQFQPRQQFNQQFRPGQPSQQPIRPEQTIHQPFRPEQLPQQQFRPGQPLFRPDSPSKQHFRPDHPSQQLFRPEYPTQKPFRPENPSQQPFQPPHSSQQSVRPEQPFQQPCRPFQQPQQPPHSLQQPGQSPGIDQQLHQPLHSDQLPHKPLRPEQSSNHPEQPERTFQQQPFQPQQMSQQPPRPDQTSQQPFRLGLKSRQPFRSDQPAGHQAQLPHGQPPQDLIPPEQQLPPSFRAESSLPMKPEQQHSRQIDSRSQFPPRPDQRPSSFQVDHKPFKPEQQSQIPVRPGRQPMDPPRPEQRHPSTFQPGQQPPKPFRPEPHHLPAHQIDGESSSGGPTLPKQKDLQSFSQQNLQLTDRTSNAQSYPETGAFLASQSSLVGCGGRPTPSLLSQGSRPYPSTVTSTDYLTSFSVAAAQTQLSQYQNSSSQQQTQQFQQQLLLQQQQLILQQQEMLKQQQTQHSHESDQVQIGLLLQQVLQQQKQLTDLEMKMKDKNEHEVEHKKHDVDSAKSTEDLEQAPRLVHYDDQAPGSKASEDEDISSKAVQSVTDLPKNDKLESKPSHSTTSTFVPNYEAVGMSHWFTDLANKHLSDLENTNSKELNKKTSEDSEDEHDCNKDASEDIVTSREDNEPSKTPEVLPEKELHEKTHEAEISDTQTNFPVELKKEEENPNEKVDSKHEEKFDDNEESKVDETKKEEETSDDEETEETHQPDIEDQIKQIKELQQRPQQHLAGYLYEPGSLPTGISSHNEPTSTEQDDDKPLLLRQCGHYYESQISCLDQDTNNSCLSDDESLQALVSAVKGFDLVVKSLSAAKHGTSSDGFSIEWRELERLQEYDGASMTAHAANMNQPKNRYTDILPWDHTRVKLDSKDESDYINANFIKDITPLSPSFIATQGPIATTLTDFWLMVWEQQSHLIVMLTREVEGNRLMCHQYWPIDEGYTILFGPIRVSLKTLVTNPSSVKRIMHVKHSNSQDTLVVTHLQFTGWPDKGVPESPADLLAFIVDVRSSYQRSLKESEKKPIIIHCSAGIGRTGTFIIVYSAMEEFNGHQEFVNIPRLVRYLRLQRKYMVQRREQYEFCYKTVLFYARQYLDLELASMSMKRKTGHKPAQLASEHVTPSTSSMDDAHSNVPDEEPSDSRKKSPGIRFLGELKSDDSLEEDEIRGNEKVTNEQSISEKYCKGTLETDSESTKTNTDTLEVSNGVIDEHGREGTAKSEECRDKGTEHEGSSGTSTQDIGIVSIGEHKEVRYAKVDEDEEDRNVELEYKDQDIESKGSEVKDDEGQINASVADCLDIKEDQCDSTAIDTQDTFDADSVAENKSGVEES